MRFLAAVSTTLALALGVSAIPQGQDGHGERDVKQATNQQAGGSKACCLNKSTIKSDGILNDALARGLLTDVLGASDQACAETELIGSLNLLGKNEWSSMLFV